MTPDTIAILVLFSMFWLAAAAFFGVGNILELFVYYRKTPNGMDFGIGPLGVLGAIWVLVYFVL